jgi:hypothetical protein
MIGWILFLILCMAVFGPLLFVWLGASKEATESPHSWTFRPKLVVNPIPIIEYPETHVTVNQNTEASTVEGTVRYH